MDLTIEQGATLRDDIIESTDPDVVAARGGGVVGRNDTELARLYNLASAKIVWRTNVTRAELYHQVSAEGTSWNWTTYKAQSVTEQNAWTQMFMGDEANFSLDNLRAGVDAIFSGAGGPAAQRAHVSAVAKRPATRAEALFTTGTGTLASPGKLVVEGTLTPADVGRAMNQQE